MWSKYGKSIVAFLFTLWTIIAPLWFGDRHIDPAEGIIIALAFVNNGIVYIVPLNPGFKSIKTVVNAFAAALVIAQTLIIDGLQPDDWTYILGAFIGALGVAFAPAISEDQPEPVAVGNGFDG